jgi:predicted ester cyclase
MTALDGKKNAHRLIIEGINAGNMAVIDEVLSPNIVEHNLPPGLPANREGFKMFITGFRAAFPDLKYTIEEELTDGDKVMHRLMATGTMKGDFQGMKASNKKATWQEMHIGRFDASGKIVEHWGTVDQVSMLTQLGFMPSPGG